MYTYQQISQQILSVENGIDRQLIMSLIVIKCSLRTSVPSADSLRLKLWDHKSAHNNADTELHFFPSLYYVRDKVEFFIGLPGD